MDTINCSGKSKVKIVPNAAHVVSLVIHWYELIRSAALSEAVGWPVCREMSNWIADSSRLGLCHSDILVLTCAAQYRNVYRNYTNTPQFYIEYRRIPDAHFGLLAGIALAFCKTVYDLDPREDKSDENDCLGLISKVPRTMRLMCEI